MATREDTRGHKRTKVHMRLSSGTRTIVSFCGIYEDPGMKPETVADMMGNINTVQQKLHLTLYRPHLAGQRSRPFFWDYVTWTKETREEMDREEQKHDGGNQVQQISRDHYCEARWRRDGDLGLSCSYRTWEPESPL